RGPRAGPGRAAVGGRTRRACAGGRAPARVARRAVPRRRSSSRRRGRRTRGFTAENRMIIAVLAQNTFREVVRDKVLLGTVAFGFALMLLTRLLSPLVLGEDVRLTVDLGLSSVTGFARLIGVMVGASVVGKEIDRRTIYNLLSRPVARPLYLVGKWIGLCAALWVVALMLGAGLQVILLWVAGTSRFLPVLAG